MVARDARAYGSIPDPTADLNSLRESVVALKQAVEVLTRQRGSANSLASAVTFADLGDPSLLVRHGTDMTTYATDAQALAKTATAAALTPANLAALGSTDGFAGLVELATDAETATGTDTARALTAANLTAAGLKQGKHTIWIPAGAMIAATTSGPASAQMESTTNDINHKVFDFDASADEHAHFNIAMPKSWNEGTVTFQAYWTTAGAVTTGVAWGLQGIALSDNEAIDTAWGTAVVVTDDAQSAANEIYVTAESAAVTIGGTPAAEDITFFRVFRDVSDANDDMTQDARLIGIKLFITLNAATDA